MEHNNMWKPPPPPPPPPDLHHINHRHHLHHHPTYNHSSSSPYHNPQFQPPPQPQPTTYPNFYPNLNLPPPPPPPPDFRLPPPPPDFRLPPPPPFPHPTLRSPNFTPPIHDQLNHRVSWPEWNNHRRSDDFRFYSRDLDEWEPLPNSQEVGVGEFVPQRFGSCMNVDKDRASRYDSAGSDFCRSSGYRGFFQSSTSPMDFQGDRMQRERDVKRQRYEIHKGDKVPREWDVKRHRYEDVPISVSGVRHGEFEGGNEGPVVPRVQRKSALLRIVDSSPQNGYHSKKRKSSGLCSSSKTSLFKDKYSSPAKHRIKKEGENSPRQNTPVHVSFKSNSLVAKQIVAPSSPIDITNNSGTPRNRKFGKLAAPDGDDLITSPHEENQSPLKLPKSGYSPQNPSHSNTLIELSKVSDCSVVDRNLFDVCASPVKQVGSCDTFSSAENFNSSGDKKLAKPHKKQILAEYRVPLSIQSKEEQSGGVRFSPTEVLNYKGSKEICHFVSTSSTETGSLVNTVDDHSHNLLAQHIGEATMESSMKQCGGRQSDSDYQESQLSDDYCCKETVSNITAVNVNEIDFSKHPHDKCIQISPLEANLLCNTIIDQTCPDGITEEGIEECIIILNADDNVKVDQDLEFSSTSMKKRKERSTQFDFSDAVPAAKACEIDLFNKVTIDSGKGVCASPDPVGMKKEVTFVIDMEFVPLGISSSNCDLTTTALNEAASHSLCDDQRSLVPVSSGSMSLRKDGFNISNLAQGSSLSASGIETSTMKTGSDPEVQLNLGSHERMSEGRIISISKQFEHQSTEVALWSATKRVGNALAKTNLAHATQVDALSPASTDINNLKPSRATSGSLKYQKPYALAPHEPFPTSVCFAHPKVQSSKMHPNKSRTWHRGDNDSTVSAGKTSRSNSVHTLKSGKPQGTSYIRKGNSLVRNPSPVGAVFRTPQISTCPASLSSSTSVESKIGFSENKDNVTIGRNRSGTGSSDNLRNFQNNEAGQSIAKTSSFVFDTLQVKSPSVSLSPTRPVTDFCSKTNSSPLRFPESTGLVQLHDDMKLKDTTENQYQSLHSNSLVTQAAVNKGSCILSTSDYISAPNYDPCQQISAPSRSPLAAEDSQSNQILSSDGYYKTRMNQIIRTPVYSGQPLLLSKCDLNTEEGIYPQNMVGRTSTLQSYKGTVRKPSDLSLVWTLQGAQAQPTSKFTEGRFQCKRPTNWRGGRNSRASINIRATSVLRKLTLYRNQNTLYKRSTHGLSLRKYKVVAMGGCSLKWSKSIEKRSKKANEDATRAVVAAESLKRVQSRLQNPMLREATKHNTSRGHIFRIGSGRYKTDPSRNTLRRVIVDGSVRGDFKDNDSKKAYIPTRLAIWKKEYIRIGNGNQLIRDPKKRIRMLANEKVQWSLHNVRQRSLKKQRFCQFYTRFGKCNKDNGKCPYIHDSSKIAVCTKFLRGMCSDPYCKLTHKVIPERMEDCSYFLLGMCSSESCPYRHVNVNPKASTCEGFLRGYCADGDECQKKHSYICHIYEETGSCPEGPKCKLHHPKKQKAKHTLSRLQNSSKGRYFTNPAPEFSEPQTVAPLKLSGIKNSRTFKDGEFPEFISIDDSDDDDVNVREDVSCSIKHNDMDIEVFDLNTFIKPVRIMKKDIRDISLDNPGIPGS